MRAFGEQAEHLSMGLDSKVLQGHHGSSRSHTPHLGAVPSSAGRKEQQLPDRCMSHLLMARLCSGGGWRRNEALQARAHFGARSWISDRSLSKLLIWYEGQGLTVWSSLFYQHHLYTNWDFIYSKLIYLILTLPTHSEYNLCLQMHCYNGFFCTLFILQTMKLQGFPSANLSILKGRESGCRMDFILRCSYWSLDNCLLQV